MTNERLPTEEDLERIRREVARVNEENKRDRETARARLRQPYLRW